MTDFHAEIILTETPNDYTVTATDETVELQCFRYETIGNIPGNRINHWFN